MKRETSLSRRAFLETLSSVAGPGATYAAMSALGLLNTTAAASPLPRPGTVDRHRTVAIVGAGITGLSLAYELERRGFSCTVLEASPRAGGRVLTLRGGDTVAETANPQSVPWPRQSHLYANMGPARIPYHHRNLLGYCQNFDIPVEVFVNENRGALVHDSKTFGSQPVENRYFTHATRGWLSELLAKAVNRQALDDMLTGDDKARLLSMLKGYGELDNAFHYTGASRSGYTTPPGGGLQAGTLRSGARLDDLLRSEFVKSNMNFTEEWNQAATMFQPVGGMDRITEGFLKRLTSPVHYNRVVEQIRKREGGARVIYRDAGGLHTLDTDFAVITVPFPALQGVETDLSAEHQAAMASCSYTQAAKIAFLAERRFWEEDQGIFGGISWTTGSVGQIWYPSNNFMGRGGILMGAYIRGDNEGRQYAKMNCAERLEAALECGQCIHPTYRNEVQQGISVCWPNMPYARGGWAVWSESARKAHYPVLTRPDGPLYLAGDQVSYLPGWQEGSLLSAHAVAADLIQRASAEPARRAVPA